MSIKSDLAAQLVLALQDVRCANPRLILEQMLKRETFGGGIPEYRVEDIVAGTNITTAAELIAHITESNISLQVSTALSSSSFKDKCKPVKIVPTNLIVTLYQESVDDSFFNHNVSKSANRICFVMGYVGDNDPVLPMKLLDVYLVGKE